MDQYQVVLNIEGEDRMVLVRAPRTGKADQVLQELKQQHMYQKEQFQILQNHMKRTEEYRDRLIGVLETYFSMKRKREDSDEE